jgi:osmotically-inducible protein OsmY
MMAKVSSEIERDVKEEMHWHRSLDASDIAVSANGGVVSLTGFVKSCVEKYEAERAAKRVAGVSAIANDIEVRLSNREGYEWRCTPARPQNLGSSCSAN